MRSNGRGIDRSPEAYQARKTNNSDTNRAATGHVRRRILPATSVRGRKRGPSGGEANEEDEPR